jgi:hypothetical protein
MSLATPVVNISETTKQRQDFINYKLIRQSISEVKNMIHLSRHYNTDVHYTADHIHRYMNRSYTVCDSFLHHSLDRWKEVSLVIPKESARRNDNSVTYVNVESVWYRCRSNTNERYIAVTDHIQVTSYMPATNCRKYA